MTGIRLVVILRLRIGQRPFNARPDSARAIRQLEVVEVDDALRLGVAGEAEPVELRPAGAALLQAFEAFRRRARQRDGERPAARGIGSERRFDLKPQPLAGRHGEQFASASAKLAVLDAQAWAGEIFCAGGPLAPVVADNRARFDAHGEGDTAHARGMVWAELEMREESPR